MILLNRMPLGMRGPDPKPKSLTPQQMGDWNKFLDFVKAKGYEGSAELDKKDKNLGQSLFNEFKKANPKTSIDYSIVPSVQTEMQKLKTNTQSFLERRNDPNAKSVMSGVSKVDGWMGSKTSQYRFPDIEEKNYHNGNLVSSQNLGLVNGDWKPVGLTGSVNQSKPLPPNAKLEKMSDGRLYYENSDGDLVLYQ